LRPVATDDLASTEDGTYSTVPPWEDDDAEEH
jgi:hypothetical protein